MTIIQPHKNYSSITVMVAALVCAVAISGVAVVVLYNGLVNAEHRVSALTDRMEKTRSANEELQGQIFSMLSGDNLERLVPDRGLVREKDPTYITFFSLAPWLASR